jgi:hypothetical protein
VAGAGTAVKAGDIVAVRGKGWLSRGILMATHGQVSHVGMLISAEPVIVIEALSRVRTRPLAETLHEVEAAWILSDRSLTEAQRITLIERACLFSADGYGYAEIVKQALDAAFKTTWFTDNLSRRLDQHPICSYLVAKAYASIGLNFGAKRAESITPADIYRFALGHPDLYDVMPIQVWRMN